MTDKGFFATSLTMMLLVMGCGERNASSTRENVSSPGPAISNPVSDQWAGKWTGPEGTYLQVEGKGGKYEVTIRNLDGPRTFPAATVGAGIAFERDGMKEVIRATSGDGTGMKWLAGKTDCLTVRVGEGYCKD